MSSGLWILASYINHACDANVNRSFIGDFMIVRATKDVKKDQEIFVQYNSAGFDAEQARKELEMVWEFKCTCRVCTADLTTSPSDRARRQALSVESELFMARTARDVFSGKVDAVITEAKKLWKRLDATHDKVAFAGVPRPPLFYLGFWFCFLYQTKKSHFKVIETAQSTLREAGYAIEVNGGTLTIDDSNCTSDGMDGEVAMCAACVCYDLGDEKMGRQYEAFAKKMYLIQKGEMRGFGGIKERL